MDRLAFSWLATAGLIVTALAMTYGIVAWLSVRLYRSVARKRVELYPPVTILKPLCGDEHQLYECLRTFCDQDYPEFQIVFGVSDPKDPALSVVRRLQAEFPKRDFAIAIDPRQPGSNRKVNNLANMMPLCRHDYLVIADSDVRVPPDYLSDIVSPLLDSGVGIVTCPYRGWPRPGLWSLVASLFVNDWFMPSVRVAAAFGSRSFAFGATIALRRNVLFRIGGFAAIMDQLADDYRLGELTRRLGLRTVLSDVIVETCVDEPSLAVLVRHELRWLRTIRSVRPVGYALAFFSFTIPMASIGAVMAGVSGPALTLLAVTIVARLMLHFSTHDTGLPARRLWVLLFNDFMAIALWACAFFTRRVHWREIRYSVADDGAVHPTL